MLEQFKRQSLETQGIIFMILSQFFFAANDGFVKYILLIHDNDISFLGQIVFIRGIFATIFIGLILFAKKQLELKRMLTSKHLLTRGIDRSCLWNIFFSWSSIPTFCRFVCFVELSTNFNHCIRCYFIKRSSGLEKMECGHFRICGSVGCSEPGRIRVWLCLCFSTHSSDFDYL